MIDRSIEIMKTMVILVIIFLISCTDEINNGIVIGKIYEEENTYYSVMNNIIYVNRNLILIPTQYLITDDEDFILIVEYINKKNKRIKKNIYVSSEYYNKVKVGDSFIFKKEILKQGDDIKKTQVENENS